MLTFYVTKCVNFFQDKTFTSILPHYHIKKCVDILGGRTYPVRYYPIALRLRDIAFGNEIARMISLCSIIESNSYLRSPHSLTKLVGAQKKYRAFLCITHNPQSGDSSGVMLGVRSVALLHLYLSSLSANNLHEVTIYLRNVLTSKKTFFNSANE